MTAYQDSWIGRFKENGTRVLEQFAAAGGTTKEVEMDWELFGWKPRDMTECCYYSKFEQFLGVNEGDLRHFPRGQKAIY
jgi:hypothetical protein